MKFRLPQAYFSKIMRAIVEFEMIERGDRILIGLSGGKDSLLLTYALAMMRERTKGKFSLHALTIDPMFDNAFDTESLSRFAYRWKSPMKSTKSISPRSSAASRKTPPASPAPFSDAEQSTATQTSINATKWPTLITTTTRWKLCC